MEAVWDYSYCTAVDATLCRLTKMPEDGKIKVRQQRAAKSTKEFWEGFSQHHRVCKSDSIDHAAQVKGN